MSEVVLGVATLAGGAIGIVFLVAAAVLLRPRRRPEKVLPPGPVLVVEPGVAFAEISRVFEGLGFRAKPTVSSLPPLIPGEPEMSSWVRGEEVVRYDFHPVLRHRELTFPDEPLRKEIARRLPWVPASEAHELLASTDERDVLRALLLVRSYGVTECEPRVARLAWDERERIARLAAKVIRALKGTPETPAPRRPVKRPTPGKKRRPSPTRS